MSDRWTERLSEYLDGDLADRERGLLEAHLEECTECRDALAALRDVVARAGALPTSAPDIDLWPQIAARIGAGDAAAPDRARPVARPLGWRLSLSLPQAFAAAAVLVLISVASAWWAVGRAPWLVTRGPSETGDAPLRVSAGPTAPSPSPSSRMARRSWNPATLETAAGEPAVEMSASAAFTDPRYDATVAELQRILDQERDRLDPGTVKVLEENLQIIDRAVADARRAVDADPSSAYLREHLASMMKQKMQLLRQATQLASQG